MTSSEVNASYGTPIIYLRDGWVVGDSPLSSRFAADGLTKRTRQNGAKRRRRQDERGGGRVSHQEAEEGAGHSADADRGHGVGDPPSDSVRAPVVLSQRPQAFWTGGHDECSAKARRPRRARHLTMPYPLSHAALRAKSGKACDAGYGMCAWSVRTPETASRVMDAEMLFTTFEAVAAGRW